MTELIIRQGYDVELSLLAQLEAGPDRLRIRYHSDFGADMAETTSNDLLHHAQPQAQIIHVILSVWKFGML